jgi:hypothetical protein
LQRLQSLSEGAVLAPFFLGCVFLSTAWVMTGQGIAFAQRVWPFKASRTGTPTQDQNERLRKIKKNAATA